MNVVVSIGNTDSKLSQLQWANFVADVESEVQRQCERIHGRWFSTPVGPYQNAAWCFDLYRPGSSIDLKNALSELARRYDQDSIAWLAGTTEFISPADVSGEPMPAFGHSIGQDLFSDGTVVTCYCQDGKHHGLTQRIPVLDRAILNDVKAEVFEEKVIERILKSEAEQRLRTAAEARQLAGDGTAPGQASEPVTERPLQRRASQAWYPVSGHYVDGTRCCGAKTAQQHDVANEDIVELVNRAGSL